MTDHLPRARAIAQGWAWSFSDSQHECGTRGETPGLCEECDRRAESLAEAIAAYGATVERETLEAAAQVADQHAADNAKFLIRRSSSEVDAAKREAESIAVVLRQRAKETR